MIGPSDKTGRKLSAPTMMMTVSSQMIYSGVGAWQRAALAGTSFWQPLISHRQDGNDNA